MNVVNDPLFVFPPEREEEPERTRASEREATKWFRERVNAELVAAFWRRERPADWPDVIPFPTDMAAEKAIYDEEVPYRRRRFRRWTYREDSGK